MLTIRKAGPKDFSKLKPLRVAFFLEECAEDGRLDPSWVDQGLGIELAKGLRSRKNAYFLAVAEGKAIGYAHAPRKANNH